MLKKEFEWKIRSIIEKSAEILNDPDTPDYIKEILDDIKEIAQSIQNEFDNGKIRFTD